MDSIKCAGFEFFCNFDSANLARVEFVQPNEATVTPANNSGKSVVPDISDFEFNIWTKPDCCGTEFENGNRTWFYFGMKANISSVLVRINMVNLNRQAKMYSQGMAPVYKVVPGKPHWERIRDKPIYSTDESVFTLSFKYKTPENAQSITYFAFTYPFSYGELQQMLCNIDSRFQNLTIGSKDDIYYARECVCYSLEGRRVDLITITSYHNISAEREVRLKNLFPNDNIPRPFRFIGKKIIFISARVHPGETPSSFVFNGLLNFLLNREDSTAVILRRLYVFKLIPCLNPDGVAKGHYRTDTRGVNLNRVYLNPKFSLHPSIYASRALIRYYHFGFEKEEDEKCDFVLDMHDNSSVGDENPQSDNKLSKKISHMTLEEKKLNAESCGCKCKKFVVKLEDMMPNISGAVTSFDNSIPLCPGKELCCNCASVPKKTGSGEESNTGNAAVYSHGDANCNESGLYLYIDMHGHASKKGIFMYGNHFEDIECNVECMLLPKIMSINNHNFHFTACNFTERNMYLRDRRDGMSREGSGRVAVLKLTGLVRSYTLECNYNTGRLVNVLPPTIREANSKVHTLLVPPKYTPQVFEEVGKALGASILDLTGQNPNTRIPNSEFHSLSGLREWLRVHCANELGETRSAIPKYRLRNSASLHAQGKTVRAVIIKTRSSRIKAASKKLCKGSRSTPVPIERKENIALHSANVKTSQPSCSRMHCISTLQHSHPGNRTGKSVRPKLKRENLRYKSSASDKQSKSASPITQNASSSARQRLKGSVTSKLQTFKEKNTKMKTTEKQTDSDRIQLREICLIKENDRKKVIAKYKSEKPDMPEENLIVSWDPCTSHAQVFSEKQTVQSFIPSKSSNEAGPSKQGAFRVHNFTRSSSFTKINRNKRTLRRLTATAEPPVKLEKLKKRKKIKTKIG